MFDFLSDVDWGDVASPDTWYDSYLPDTGSLYEWAGDATANAGSNWDFDLGSLFSGAKDIYKQVGGANTMKMAGALMNMYNQNKMAKSLAPQLHTLNNLYAPGSPEANLMKQEMDRKDAAAGRRSQYGTRATELAARLASNRANTLTSPGYMNMQGAYNSAKYGKASSLFDAIGSMDGGEKTNYANGGQVRKRFQFAEIPDLPTMAGISAQNDLGSMFSPDASDSEITENTPDENGQFGTPGAFMDAFGPMSVMSMMTSAVPGPLSIANAISELTTDQSLFSNISDLAMAALGLNSGEAGPGDGSDGTMGGFGGVDDGFGGEATGFGGDGMGAVADASDAMGDDGTGVAANGGRLHPKGLKDMMAVSPTGRTAPFVGKMPGHDLKGKDDRKINVSGGEYVVPTDVVDAVGPEFFDTLNKLFHKPIKGRN